MTPHKRDQWTSRREDSLCRTQVSFCAVHAQKTNDSSYMRVVVWTLGLKALSNFYVVSNNLSPEIMSYHNWIKQFFFFFFILCSLLNMTDGIRLFQCNKYAISHRCGNVVMTLLARHLEWRRYIFRNIEQIWHISVVFIYFWLVIYVIWITGIP